VTLDNMQLIAKLQNGNIVEGESQIPEEAIKQNSRIEEFKIVPESARALTEALQAIKEADAIVMGPGSLYTSITSNLLVKDIAKEVKKSDAVKIYISNIMTQPGETTGFKVSDHLKVLLKYGGKDIVDYVIANTGEITEELREKYQKDGADLVKLDREDINSLGIKIVGEDLVKIKNGLVKHDADKLAEILADTIMEKKLLYDKKKIIEYMYLSQRIKERVREEKGKEND
ncbi:gluconeogenesis factor YvcK family protein, partial [Clostridium beijerinckii]